MSGWKRVKLGVVLRPVARSVVPVPGTLYRQLGVRLWGQGAYEREPVDGVNTKYAQLFRAEAGDVVVNKIWARHGSVAVVPGSLSGCHGSAEFPMFAPDRAQLEPMWMHWLTRTPGFWAACDEKSQGSSGKNRIRPERFLEIEIFLPPLPEQRRVVERVQEVAAWIREALGLRSASGAETQALLSSAGSAASAQGGAPQSTLFDLIGKDGLKNGKSVKSQPGISGVRCLTLSSIRNGKVDLRESKPVPLLEGEASPYRVAQGDVFVVRGNGSKDLCGRAGLVSERPENVIFPDLFIRVDLPARRILPEYFVSVWNSASVRRVLEEKAKTTSGIWKVNQGHLLSTEFPLPSLEKQQRIVVALNALRAEVSPLSHLQAETATELDALLPAVLDRAFRGELT